MSMREIDDFIETLRIFPGHRVKVFALIEKISVAFKNDIKNSTRNYNSNNLNSTKNACKKRFHSTGTNRLKINNPKKLAMIYGINKNIGGVFKKPKSVEPVKSKNRIIKNFLNNEGFGFNYFLKDKQEMTDNEYVNVVNRDISGKTEISDNNNNKGKLNNLKEKILLKSLLLN
jgi:hypothetical protein